ncbi:MAG: hypothetical protein LBN07_01240 [Christensenellaceae bacterium]|jgi:hypothetical protein|nr:hypothetical protein [Christensenellaceae bacterium]
MFKKAFNTQNYLGKNKTDYFEGWYFRTARDHPFSFIAGVSKNMADPHSFIMFISRAFSHYFRFDLSEFKFDKQNMTITIAKNIFSLNQITVDLQDAGITLCTHLKLSNHSLFKKSIYSPSVMGPFGYLKMRCNHAVISLKHNVSGTIALNNQKTKVNSLGYIEKDFGSNFPKNYVWAHGMNNELSIMFAYAHPLTLGMRGFLCIILHKGKQYNFSLYTLAKLSITKESEQHFKAKLKKGKNYIEFDIKNSTKGHILPAPAEGGKMKDAITESLSAEMCGTFCVRGLKISFSFQAAYEFVSQSHAV